MDTLSDLHPGIQYAVRRLQNPSLTFEALGAERGISKQAVQKQCKEALGYLRRYAVARESTPEPEELKPCTECAKRDNLPDFLEVYQAIS